MEGLKENCFYSILGLQKDCSTSEVRCAYRKLAMKWHPDKCAANDSTRASSAKASENAKTQFQAIQEAYSVLSDNNKRLMYDAGVYDGDDDGLEMSSFVGEMAAMMSSSAKEADSSESLDELKAMFLNIVGNVHPKPDISNKRSSDCLREKATGTHWNGMPLSTREFKNQDLFIGGFHSEAIALGNENNGAFAGGDIVDSQELEQMFMSIVDPEFYASARSIEPSDKFSRQKDNKNQCKSRPTTFDELVAETLFPEGGISGSDLFGADSWIKTNSAVCSEVGTPSTALAGENGDGKRRKLCPGQKDANKASAELDYTYGWSADSCGKDANKASTEVDCTYGWSADSCGKDANKASAKLDCSYGWSADICGISFSHG
ncbi:hypothetical protein KI387_007916, partial [Taxus chinensis]